MVHGRTHLRIRAGSLHVFLLLGDRRDVSLVCKSFFFRRGARLDPTVAAVEADPVHRNVVNPGVVNVVNVGHVHIQDCPVVEEMAAVPTSTLEAYAEVTESIVDPAVEADMRPPITFMKKICAVAPAPPAGRPKKADFRRQHPGSGHPVVVANVVIVGPIAGRPEITIARANRLLVNRQSRGTDPDRDADLCGRGRGQCQHYQDSAITANNRVRTKGMIRIVFPLARSSFACPVLLCCYGLRG